MKRRLQNEHQWQMSLGRLATAATPGPSKILFLDGAMGTCIQGLGLSEDDFRGERFANHAQNLKGNNDLLSLTRPDVIIDIHKRFLEAGADIIETNTFNATPVSQANYGTEAHCFEINERGARIARRAIDDLALDRSCFVAGSMGPTHVSLSMSGDVGRPEHREIDFDALEQAYYVQAEGLAAGGVDVFLIETVFDTLNLKAAIHALQRLFETTKRRYPIMISVTVSDASGRLLSGQTLEACWETVRHARPMSFGLNCALGAKEMHGALRELHQLIDCPLSCYPNAGIPNPLSPNGYDDSPNSMAAALKQFAEEGLINIAGGCCGTTPEHIAAIVEALKDVPPRQVPPRAHVTRLAGLETLSVDSNFLVVGERTNVAGSSVFKKCVQENRWNDALAIARKQVENGANVLDINFDDALLDAKQCMQTFLRLLASDPEIATIPWMPDSSHVDVLEVALKNIQGKPLINSLSLKEGEAAFLQHARMAQRFGAAFLVMAVDENGQATTCNDKVRICQRAYQLLTENGFPPEDIFFDPNILPVGTGLSEHSHYAIEFIEGVRAIKQVCPFAHCSGGISNLSFAFRGNDFLRENIHSVFLYHAIRAGLDMGIVNAGKVPPYDTLPTDLRGAIEALLFNTSPTALEDVLAFAHSQKNQNASTSAAPQWRSLSIEERLAHALQKGVPDFLNVDIPEALQTYAPLEVLEGPLMCAMRQVGDAFAQGKMFLPQIVKTARVMKEATDLLFPAGANISSASNARPTLVLATVKGDVHDIGKNIVKVVLECNGYRVVDVGIRVSGQAIVEAVRREGASVIGLSGLITPSLEEMLVDLKLFEAEGLRIPVLIGGATTSALHTALKLMPAYHGPVVYVKDAASVVDVCKQLEKCGWAKIREEYVALAEAYEAKTARVKQSFDGIAHGSLDWTDFATPQGALGLQTARPTLDELMPFFDWTPFFVAWGLRGAYPQILKSATYGDEAKKLFADAQQTLAEMGVCPKAVWGFFHAHSDGDSVSIFESGETPLATFQFVRQKKPQNGVCHCLADFIAPRPRVDVLGLFAVTSGQEVYDALPGDDYKALLTKTLCDRIAEAAAEWLHAKVRRDFRVEGGIRPAPGYPACPDHALKATIWNVLDVSSHTNMQLTETYAMTPPSSICGFFFLNPESCYFL